MKARLLNIVVLGGSRVGKTCLISRLVEDSVPAFYQTTPKAVSKKSIALQGVDYNCLITDTAGHSTYTPISPQFIIGTHAFLLVYSIDSRESFELAKLIYEKLVEFSYPGRAAPVVFIGNKSDLGTLRTVSVEEGHSYARQSESPFLETSIHTYLEIHKALESCILHLEGQSPNRWRSPTTSPSLPTLYSLSRAYWSLHGVINEAFRNLLQSSIDQINSRAAHAHIAQEAEKRSPSLPSSPRLPQPPHAQAPRPAAGSPLAVEIPSGPSTFKEEADASATLTASEPVLKGIWSRHQASLNAKVNVTPASLPDPATIQVSLKAEDVVSNPGAFARSLEDAMAQISRARRRGSSYWGRKVPDDSVRASDAVQAAYYNMCRTFLSIAEDRVASKGLIRLADDDAQVVLDTLQLVLDAEIKNVTQGDRACLLHLLLKLAKESGRYPECLMLTDITAQDDQAVAAGHFGEIWRGVFRGRPVCMKVVKVYQKSDVAKLLKVFSREAILWSQLSHPNLLPFYGIHRLDDSIGRICLIAPWMENGCLPDYLIKRPGANRFGLAKDVCNGLQHLHNHGIVHGDLKGVNVLITKSGRACVADFGLSSVAESDVTRWSSYASSTAVGGTARWQAPELFNPDVDVIKPTKMSDIYALGCVFYEIFTGRIPFHEAPREPTVISWVQVGKQPSKPAGDAPAFVEWGLSEELWVSCIGESWAPVPEERPTIPYLILKLSKLSKHRSQSPSQGASLDAQSVDSWLSPAEVRNSVRWSRPKAARLSAQGSAKDIPRVAKGSVPDGNGGGTASWLEWFPISI